MTDTIDPRILPELKGFQIIMTVEELEAFLHKMARKPDVSLHRQRNLIEAFNAWRRMDGPYDIHFYIVCDKNGNYAVGKEPVDLRLCRCFATRMGSSIHVMRGAILQFLQTAE